MSNKPVSIEEAVKICTPLVKSTVNKWLRGHYGDYNDLLQSGFEGVCEAYHRFDKDAKVKFTTYAWFWIRALIRNNAMKNWDIMNKSVNDEILQYIEVDNNDDILSLIDYKGQVDKLSKKEQEVLRMRMEGYTFKEIAEKCGFSNLGSARKFALETQEKIAS